MIKKISLAVVGVAFTAVMVMNVQETKLPKQPVSIDMFQLLTQANAQDEGGFTCDFDNNCTGMHEMCTPCFFPWDEDCNCEYCYYLEHSCNPDGMESC